MTMAQGKSLSSMPSFVSQDPEDYKKIKAQNFDTYVDVEDIFLAWDRLVPPDEWDVIEQFVLEIASRGIETEKDFQKALVLCRRTHKYQPKKSQLLHVFLSLEQAGHKQICSLTQERRDALRRVFTKKANKSNSGVLVITVLTSPYPKGADGKKQRFSCEWNCYYCPNEPGQPRSYLHDEPSVLRANRNKFDPVLQFIDRAVTLAMNGHPVDKIELLILGGTWASYPHSYQEEFIRDLFFAANTFYSRCNTREKMSLFEEKLLNEKARCKIIGITLETRPDCINAEEIKRFRYYGCTRVQLGVQHTSNSILKTINRGCTTADTKNALRLLKDSCYKVDIHLMPNLPDSNPEIDRKMFDEVLMDEDLQADQWKIYPCETTPWTVIQKWHQNGTYVPYSEDELLELLMTIKPKVHPWIRLNRIIRDIPSQYIVAGVDNPSMRMMIQRKMAERGQKCKCIRCREVRDRDDIFPHLVVRKYRGQGGLEYFISFESEERNIILGFCRLRINELVDPAVAQSSCHENSSSKPQHETQRGRGMDVKEGIAKRKRSKTPLWSRKQNTVATDYVEKPSMEKKEKREDNQQVLEQSLTPFPELVGAALVRELHVYGKLIPTVEKGSKHAQNIGLGTRLMLEMERIAKRHRAKKIAVIAGVGVRDFYRKLGYELEGESEMMMKHLKFSFWERCMIAFAGFSSSSRVILVGVLLLVVLIGLDTIFNF